MFNNFDGNHRRTPNVSIRGASKKESKAELLERAQRERSEREVGQNILNRQTIWKKALHCWGFISSPLENIDKNYVIPCKLLLNQKPYLT